MAKPSEMSVEQLDEEIGRRGEQIAALKAEQRKFLAAKDKKVEAEVRELLADPNTQKVGS